MKLNQLTFTRFLAAIAIVFFHYGITTFPFNSGFFYKFFSSANIFVTYFFILSGFVMIIAYGKKDSEQIDYSTYYTNRFARIYPLYLVGLIAVVLIDYINYHTIDFKNFLLQSVLLQSWLPNHTLRLNRPGWSLSVEVFFYLVFPVLFNRVYRKIKPGKLFVSLIIIFFVSHVLLYILKNSSFYKGFPSVSHDLIYYFPLSNFSDFLIGNCLGVYFLRIREKHPGNYDLIIFLAFAALCFLLGNNTGVLFAPILFLIFILFLSLNKTGFITRLFSTRGFIFLGEISYGIYILQRPVFSSLILLNDKFHLINDGQVFYAGLFILLIVSTVLYYVIEVPVKIYIRTWHGSLKERYTLKTIKSGDTSAM